MGNPGQPPSSGADETRLGDRPRNCRLTTRGRRTGRPHTVTIWFAAGGEAKIYLGTLRMGRDWPKNVAVNPDVVIEIDGLRLAGDARLVTDEAARRTIESRLAGKYWPSRIASWLGFRPQGVFEVTIRGEAGCPADDGRGAS